MVADILDKDKAAKVWPLGNGNYDPPVYVAPGTEVTVKIESREMEVAILAAHDYGLDALGDEGKHQLNRLIADLKVAITGR